MVEADGTRLAQRLAAANWSPVCTFASLGAVTDDDLAGFELVVVACTAETLVSPTLQDEAMRLGLRIPLVAVVTTSGVGPVADAARLGWRGFASAGSPTSAIMRTISAVAGGELSFPSRATGILARALAHFAPVGTTRSPAADLTPRQRQIVALIARGATDAEIAVALRISESTAHKHVQNARKRLNARTRSQLVAASRDLPIGADPLTGLAE